MGDNKRMWKIVCCNSFSQGWKSLYNTVIYVMKVFNSPLTTLLKEQLQIW